MVVVVETVGHQEVEEVCVTLTRRASATEDLLADSPTKFNSPICNLSDRIGLVILYLTSTIKLIAIAMLVTIE